MNDPKQKTQRKKGGLVFVAAGIATLTLGYVLLAKGSITAAPILIVGSFGLLAAGILVGWD